MRSWIVRETGEVRLAKRDEYILLADEIERSTGDGGLAWPILSVTPLPTREEMEKKYHKYKGVQQPDPWQEEAFMACYDLLFGEQPAPEKIPDDWF